MERFDDQTIEDYLRNTMSADSRQEFESALAADAELRRRTDDMRQLMDGLRQAARADIRRQVEAVRDIIVQVEQHPEEPGAESARFPWRLLFELVLIAGLLWLGYLHFTAEPAQPAPVSTTSNPGPVAQQQYPALFRGEIPGPKPGEKTQLTVLDKSTPAGPGHPSYALDEDGGGLCLYVHQDDNFWKKTLQLTREGEHFYLYIGGEKYLLEADGEDHLLFTE